jgi:hypothetical protein
MNRRGLTVILKENPKDDIYLVRGDILFGEW